MKKLKLNTGGLPIITKMICDHADNNLGYVRNFNWDIDDNVYYLYFEKNGDIGFNEGSIDFLNENKDYKVITIIEFMNLTKKDVGSSLRLKLDSLAYEIVILDECVKVGCQKINLSDARKIGEFLLKNIPEDAQENSHFTADDIPF